MKFTVDGEPETKVNLTLEPRNKGDLGDNYGEIFLLANGETIMGFYQGKFRLYSGGSNVKGITTSQGLIRCHNPNLVT